MIFSDYLKMCKSFLMNDMTVVEFMLNFFGDLSSEENKDNESAPFQMESNHRKATKVYYGEKPMAKRDALFMKTHFNEEALMSKVESLEEYVQQNLIDELSKKGISATFENLPIVMCDLFRKYMEEMASPKKNKSFRDEEKNKDAGITAAAAKEAGQKMTFDSRTMELARNFCIDHEEEKRYLVLCQIAENINPLHKHVRSMYTEYLRQNDDVKRAIMSLYHIPILTFEPDWQYDYLENFRKDIKELALVTEKDLLYEGGKYFHRAEQYAEIKLIDKNPRIFPATPVGGISDFRDPPYRSDLLNYIDEHMYYKNRIQEAFEYVKEPPFDWMIEHLNLLGCEESELTYWMCLFIWSACLIIPREIPSRKKPEVERTEENEDDYYWPKPLINEAEYMEDLYYLTLYTLHDLYFRDK